MKAVAASAATKRRWSESSDAPTKKALKKAGVKAVADIKIQVHRELGIY